jgi:peptidoglycan/LPS O-acetylase OafA/YrhL
MKHLPAIDGLRAIAVLAVVAYHAGLIPAGFVGVDVFFVISGYLITRLLAEEYALTRRIDFVAFYARRARRILPALAVVILATLGLSVLLLPDAGDVAKSAAAASAFVANLFFAAQTSDYWAQSSETMPLLHLWSLSVEEQFYLVWPLVLILARRKPVAALAVLACASLAYAEWMLARSPSVAFYAMPARAWELAVGGLLALTNTTLTFGSGPERKLNVGLIGLALVLLACVVPFAHFPGLGALPAMIGAALVIAGKDRVRVLEARPVVYVGLISYSLYLWHWPLLALDRALRAGPVPWGVRLALVAVAFLLAAATYRYVETPFRRIQGRRRVVLAGGAFLVALSCGAWSYGSRPAPVVESDTIVASEVPPKGCHNGFRDPVRACSGNVIVWGDSMAWAWSPLGDVGNSRDACPPLLGFPEGKGTVDRSCRAFTEAALVQAQRAHRVILAAAWLSYPREAVEKGLDATLSRLHDVTIIGPTPVLRDAMKRCLRYGVEACAVPRAEFAAQAAPMQALLRKVAAKHGARYVEPMDRFCTATVCPAVLHGKPLYWDDRHVSMSAVKQLRGHSSTTSW